MARKTEAERVIDTLKGSAAGAPEIVSSAALPVRPGVTAPPPPTGLILVSNVTIRSGGAPKALVTIAWTPSLGGTITQYLIQVARNSAFTASVQYFTASGSSAALTLDAGVTYYVRVRAESPSGPSDWSSLLSFPAASDTTAPAALTGIDWSWAASGDLLITWDLPSDAATRIVQVDIYDSASKTTLYRSLQSASSVLWTAAMHRVDTGGTPDTAVYVELTPISWSAVAGTPQTPSPQPSLTAPATPTGINHSWSGDTGTAGPDLTVVWNSATDVAYYKLTLDTVTVTVVGQRYVLTLDQNRAQHSGTPDGVISISLVAYNGLDQASTAATATATNAAPGAPSSVSIIAVPGSIVVTVSATEPADFLTYRYRVIQTNPSAADVTVDSSAKVMTFALATAATYQVGVKLVDAFGQASSETLSSATSLDLTIGTLRADVVYSDSLGTAAATLKAALADDNRTSGGISYTASASWRWIRAERALLDRYRFVTVAITQVSSITVWYLRLSADGASWRYFAAPVTGRVLTEVADQTAAQAAGIPVATLGSSSADRAELPSTVEARYIEVWFANTLGTARVDEFYPRRLVEADNIRVEELSAISADMGSITAGTITGVTITGGTVQTAASGARVQMDSSGLKTYDSAGVVQVEATTSTDGALRWGAGSGQLDATGGTLEGQGSAPGTFGKQAAAGQWMNPDTHHVIGQLFGIGSASADHAYYVRGLPDAAAAVGGGTEPARVRLDAEASDGTLAIAQVIANPGGLSQIDLEAAALTIVHPLGGANVASVSIAGSLSVSGSPVSGIADSTFTPSFAGSGTAGTWTYSARTGIYHRIGAIVFFRLSLGASARSVAPTGNARITGLPFTSANVSNGHVPVTLDTIDTVNLLATTVQLTARIPPNTTYIEFIEALNNAAPSFLPATSFGAATFIRVSGWYVV
jgi:hypothetical protein